MLERALHGAIVGLLRRTWLVTLVTVAVCAALSARAVAALLEASYLAPAPRGSTPLPRSARPGTARPPPDGSALVARNMFCSTCAPPSGPRSTDDFVPDAELLATALGAEPLATVRAQHGAVQGSFTVGDGIPGVGRVADIGRASIGVVAPDGRRGRLWLSGAATPGRPLAPRAAAVAATPWAGKIRAIDGHTFEVDRSLVRQLVSGGMRPRGARIYPIPDHGHLGGLRLFGVRPNSLPAALGLRDGDTLTAIDGKHIASVNTLLGLYAQLDELRVVELDGTRAGRPLKITLRLR